MTQTSDRLPIRLSLTPLQVAQTPPQQIVKADFISSSNAHQWTVYPGEPSEILLQLENLSADLIEIAVRVVGNFSLHWCRLSTEGDRLLPGSKMELVLYFRVEADFFERQQPLPTPQGLLLDYSGQLWVRYRRLIPTSPDRPTEPSAFPEVQTVNFNLYLRPRSLYLNFLPEIYQEVDFIGRLLKIFEQAFEPDVQILNALWAYFDPLITPEALLPFLAYWVGCPLTPRLSLSHQRILIRQAIELYRWRGTRRGLRLYLHLCTNLPLDENLPEAQKHIAIEEEFGGQLMLGESTLGQDAFIGGGNPMHFRVRLRTALGAVIDEALVRQIIEQEKPAFCTYNLIIES